MNLNDFLDKAGKASDAMDSAMGRVTQQGVRAAVAVTRYFPDADLEFVSHTAGKNAHVGAYPNRIEIRRKQSMSDMVDGAMKTVGVSLVGGRKHGTEVYPIHGIAKYEMQKGILFTKVRIRVVGGTLELNLENQAAQQLVEYITAHM